MLCGLVSWVFRGCGGCDCCFVGLVGFLGGLGLLFVSGVFLFWVDWCGWDVVVDCLDLCISEVVDCLISDCLCGCGDGVGNFF